MQYRLDLTGYICPLPLLMARQVLDKLEKGGILTLFLNHTSAVTDFVSLCEQQGYQLISTENSADKFILTIKK